MDSLKGSHSELSSNGERHQPVVALEVRPFKFLRIEVSGH